MIKLTPQKAPYYENVTPTKIYKAILTQTGTNPPTVLETVNTLGNIIWTRDDVGIYKGTLNDTFTEKTMVNVYNVGYYGTGGGINDEDSIFVSTYLPNGDPTDDALFNTGITIEIY